MSNGSQLAKGANVVDWDSVQCTLTFSGSMCEALLLTESTYTARELLEENIIDERVFMTIDGIFSDDSMIELKLFDLEGGVHWYNIQILEREGTKARAIFFEITLFKTCALLNDLISTRDFYHEDESTSLTSICEGIQEVLNFESIIVYHDAYNEISVEGCVSDEIRDQAVTVFNQERVGMRTISDDSISSSVMEHSLNENGVMRQYPIFGSTGSLLGILMVILPQKYPFTHLVDGVLKLPIERLSEIIEKKQPEKYVQSIFQPIVEQAPVGIAIITDEGHIIHTNQILVNSTGFDMEELIGMKYDHLLLLDHDKIDSFLLEKKKHKASFEARIIRKDGRIVWHEIHISELKKDTHPLNVYIFIFTDISVRKHAEEYFNFHEEVLNKMDESVLLIKKDSYTIVYCNEVFVRDYEFEKEEILDLSMRDLMKQLLVSTDKITSLLESVKARNNWKGEIETRSRSGVVKVTRIKMTSYDHPAFGDCWICIGEDITLMRGAEESFAKYEKLKSLGVLAGGLAHDFNNLMVGISANVSLAIEQISAGSEATNFLTDSLSAVDRARKLTRQLLVFSKGGDPDKKVKDIRSIIRDVVKFNLSGSNIEAIFDFKEDLWEVMIDEGQIEQVFSNLTINAKEAMAGRGKIMIEITNQMLGEPSGLPSGNYLMIKFSDTGEGIRKENLHKIFDPYFSTKSEGSGLGLSITYSVIKRHGGDIRIESKLHKGTTFTIYLPAHIHVSKPVRVNTKLEPAIIPKGLKILVMDDQEIILRAISRILDSWSCNVDKFSKGDEVIALFEKSPDVQYDLILLDLTIPYGKGGIETCKHLRSIGYKGSIVAMSGYADEGLTNAEHWGFNEKLFKPFTVDDLTKVISRVKSDSSPY